MRFIILDAENKVIAERHGSTIVSGEIQSDTGEIGQIKQEDGTFITPEPTPIEQKPSLEEVAKSTLLETQYQTVLLEMLAGF